MTRVRAQRGLWGVVALLAVGCGGQDSASDAFPETPVERTSGLTTTINAVRPNAVVARSSIQGIPDDTTPVNDVKDASPDFDATYIQGQNSTTSSSFDLSYPVTVGQDGAVTAVNVKYFTRNSICTAAGLCGHAYSQLLNGTTVIATSAQHDLPNIEQGWYLFADSYSVPTGALPSIGNLRTRIVFTTATSSSTAPIRVSTVAADITYTH